MSKKKRGKGRERQQRTSERRVNGWYFFTPRGEGGGEGGKGRRGKAVLMPRPTYAIVIFLVDTGFGGYAGHFR